MKKILIIICSILTISFRLEANLLTSYTFEEKKFVCDVFRNMKTSTENEIFEKSSLIDDYLAYERGKESAFPEIWEKLSGKSEEIYSITFKKLENYVQPQHKQKFKEKIKKIINNKEVKKEFDRFSFAQLTPILEQCLYPYDTKEVLFHLIQKIKKEEKILFFKRTNGKELHSLPLEYFTLINNTVQPSKKFIYKYTINREPAIRLRVIQVLPSGVLVHADSNHNEFLRYQGTSADKILFIETKKAYVDKDLLRDGFYEYIGTKSYNNFLGTQTIHSFREIQGLFQDIYFYDGTK